MPVLVGAEIVLTPQQANEEMVSAIGEIIAECIKRFEAGKKINVVRMSRWLTRCCRPHALVHRGHAGPHQKRRLQRTQPQSHTQTSGAIRSDSRRV